VRRKPAGERSEEIRAVALAGRIKSMGGLVPGFSGHSSDDILSHLADPLAGTVLGLLCLRWQFGSENRRGSRLYGICPECYDTGVAFGQLIRRHAMALGYSIDRIKSPGFEMVAGGLDCRPEISQEAVNRIRGEFRDALNILAFQGQRAANATYDVCLDRLTISQAEDRIFEIKAGLYGLSKLRRRNSLANR
jgi:hypothetical protein